MSVQIRSRKKSNIPAVEVVKQLDSFPKLDKDDFIQRSPVGGIVSIVAYVIICSVIFFEIRYYWDSDVAFHFVPDTDMHAKLKVNVDITVAMPCYSIDADIIDSTDENFRVFGVLEEEDAWFEMSEKQRAHFDDIRYFNTYLREEMHAVNELLWKQAHSFQPASVPKHEILPSQKPDACRIFGSLELNKVAGNFHVAAGKAIPLANGEGHVHTELFNFGIPRKILSHDDDPLVAFLQFPPIRDMPRHNFSHRIHHMSFGDSSVGIIHPLDGDEKITQEPSTSYQYFIEIVPTDVETFLTKAKTYQYSVKDNLRIIDHNSGSHGMPGIFFKYDFSALKVIVTQTREPLFQFFIRLSSTIAGVFVTAGNLTRLTNPHT
ncbi:unnamed protein product [Nesidiocoris tenuis]|uniref:Endoplasmic reticulum vesicle transporter N-terminal domain-containing protein n=1 Tax=Nesidiocoris tenuis TaxID=355587 RepID=A0A6H5GP85_9HEMI|nr:unnamed protein product [Nesidiocoris tenuis]